MSETISRRAALVGGVAVAAAATTVATEAEARQVHMRKALEHLEAAKRQLEMAARNKGGHRAKAHRLTTDAIHQVRAGIRFAEG